MAGALVDELLHHGGHDDHEDTRVDGAAVVAPVSLADLLVVHAPAPLLLLHDNGLVGAAVLVEPQLPHLIQVADAPFRSARPFLDDAPRHGVVEHHIVGGVRGAALPTLNGQARPCKAEE